MSTSRSNLRLVRSDELAWGSLLQVLAPQHQRNSNDEVVQNYDRLASNWRPAYRASEREALQRLRLAFIDAVEPFIDATTRALLQSDGVCRPPQITSITAREEHFRVRTRGNEREFCLLGALKDAEGRSIVWQNGYLSAPTRNPMMLRIRSSDPRQHVLQYDILFSRAAFVEEMELVKLLIEPFSALIWSRPVLPVSLRALGTAACECLGLRSPDELDTVRVGPRIHSDTPSFIASGDGKECIIRFSMRPEVPFPVTRTTLL